MTTGMIGRKVGMMRLYDGAGRVRGVTVIELDSNYVTQLRTPDRDGYTAVQVGHPGNRKRITRPQRGHLREAGLERVTLSRLREFRVDDADEYSVGQQLSCEQFAPGSYIDVTARSKGRGFQGGVRRHGFRGGPKTHGQSDRHRAPGSVGAGTTPGRVFKGTRMAGHMGAAKTTVLNLLVVASDPERNLLFVEGSVPGPTGGIVAVRIGRKRALTDFEPAVLPTTTVEATVEEEQPEAAEGAGAEETAPAEAAAAEEAAGSAAEEPEAPAAEATEESPAAEDTGADTEEAPAAEAEAAVETEATDEAASEEETADDAAGDEQRQ